MFALGLLAILAAAAWVAPTVLVHTGLRDRPLEAVFAGIDGRVTSAAATWNWLSGIEFRDVAVSDREGRPVVLVGSLLIEKGILGLLLDPRDLGTVRLSGVEAAITVRPGGSSVEDVFGPWLARAQGVGVRSELELVAGTIELVDTGRNDAWRLTDLIAAGTLLADGRFAGWTMAGRLRHAGTPAPVPPVSAAGPPAVGGSGPRLDRTTIPAAAAAALARDGGWSISAPAFDPAGPRPVALTAHRLPLGASSLAATRFGWSRLLDGLADIRLDMTSGSAGHDLGGRIVIDELAMCRADSLAELLHVARCELPFDLLVAPDGLITVRELRAVSPVARAEVSGRLPSPTSDFWNWLDACASHDCGLAAEIDLAAAAGSLPEGLAVRPDVRVTGGSIQLGAVSRGDGADRVLEVRLDSRDLAAVRTVEGEAAGEPASLEPHAARTPTERPLRWNEPFTAWLKGRRGPATGFGLRIEEARVTSQAAEFSATGTPAALQMQWSVDLGGLSAEVAEVIDVGGVTLAGRSRGRLDVERAAGGVTAMRAAASITEFEWKAPGRPTWKDDTIAIDAQATGSFGLDHTSLDSARGMLTAAGDAFEATLAGGLSIDPAALAMGGRPLGSAVRPAAGASEVVAECSLTGDLGQWHRRIAAMLPSVTIPGVELAGRIAASAAVATDPAAGDVWRITRAGGEVEKFAARDGTWQVAEPRIVLTAAGLVRLLAGEIEISSAELLSSSLSLRSGGLAWRPGPVGSGVGPRAHEPVAERLARLRGRVQWQADLGRVAAWAVPAAAARRWPVAGRAWGTLDVADTQTGLNLLLETTGSQIVVAERPPGGPADAAAQPVWSEPQATLTLEVTRPFVRSAGGLVSLGDRLVVERLAFESSTVAVTARGSVEELERRRQAALDGTVSYDWEQLSRLLTPWTGGRIRFAGSGGRPFSFRGPLAREQAGPPSGSGPAESAGGTVPLPESWLTATRGREGHPEAAMVRVPVRPASTARGLVEALRDLSFDTSTAWTAAEIDGFPLAAGEVALRLVEGQLAVGPFDVMASGGRIRGAPWLTFEPAPGELVVPPGRIVERVGLTGEVCRRFLGWVSPVLADATHASGFVSIDTGGVRLPLDDLFGGEATGQVVFEQLELRPSGAMQPLVNLVSKLQAVIDPRLSLDDQAVLLRVRPEPVRVRLANRRIWHEGLVMDAGQFVLRSQGSVGGDGSLAAVVELALRGDLAGQAPVIAELMRTPIAIPLKGTLARPQFDAGALDLALRRILEHTARAVIDDGLGRGIEALFGRPQAPPPAAPTISFPR